MINENKERIQVTLTKDILSNMDSICSKLGLSRSQFIANAVGEKVYQYSLSVDTINKIIDSNVLAELLNK